MTAELADQICQACVVGLDVDGAALSLLTASSVRETLCATGRADDAIAVGGAARDALAGDQHAELCLRLARAAVVAGRWTAAEDYVERSARPNDPGSLVLRADAAFGAGRADEAAAIAAVAIERADDTGAYTSLCEALGVSARAGVRSDPAAAGAAPAVEHECEVDRALMHRGIKRGAT